MSDGQILYLNRRDVESLNISVKAIIEGVEKSFRFKGEGKIEMPPKPGIHPRKDTFIHAMPAFIGGEADLAGMKWVSGYPENPSRGIPYIQGFIILNEASTGTPLAIVDCTWITEYRTAGASALAAKYLAPPGSEVIAIIGLGVQGKVHLPFLKEVLPCLKLVKLYDINKDAERNYIREMASVAGSVELKPEKDVQSAVAGADVIITCTPIVEKPERFIPAGWLKEKSLSISVDYDSAFCEDVMKGAYLFVTDDRNQYLRTQEQGVYFRGYPTAVFADMGEICAGKKAVTEGWRRSALLMGIACHDVVTAGVVYGKALDKGSGQWLEI